MTDSEKTAANNWLQNAVVFTVTLGKLGNTRKLNTSAVETDSDKSMIAVNKKLFKCPEYEAIIKKQGEIRQYVYSRSVPCFFVGNGSYIVKQIAIRELDNRLLEFDAETAALVDEFIAVYPDAIRQASVQLRSNFNASEYLSPDEARKQFSCTWNYMQVGVPDNLDADLRERETANLASRCESAYQAINDLLVTEFSELVAHLSERLSGDRDGKPKIFRDSLVGNISEFLATFNIRNVTSSTELDAVITRAQELLAGVSAEKLRESDSLRSRVAAGFAEVKTTLDSLMTDRPSRSITFDD